MSEELLRIDRLPGKDEFRYILRHVLEKPEGITRADLRSHCEDHSLSLRQSFDNGIRLLTAISLIQQQEDNKVRSAMTPYQLTQLEKDYDLCTLITHLLVARLDECGLLTTLFNQDTVKYDFLEELIVVNVSLMPLHYPMMKCFLQAMDIATSDTKFRTRLLIRHGYKAFFKQSVLRRVFKGSETLDIVMGQKSEPVSVHKGAELPVNGVKVFISYTRADEEHKDRLKDHFSGLVRLNVIKMWHDRLIIAGEEWDTEIKRNLEEADYILFLISSDFMASDYINDIEIQRAVERYREGTVRILPIIARPCDHASLPLNKFHLLPKDARPIASWPDKDEAYLDVVNQFKQMLKGR